MPFIPLVTEKMLKKSVFVDHGADIDNRNNSCLFYLRENLHIKSFQNMRKCICIIVVEYGVVWLRL